MKSSIPAATPRLSGPASLKCVLYSSLIHRINYLTPERRNAMKKNPFLPTLALVSICAGLLTGGAHTGVNVQQRRSRPQGQTPQASPPDKTQDSGSTEKTQKERESVSG